MVKTNQPFRRPQALRKGTHIRGMDRIPSKMKQPIRAPRKPKFIIDRRKETVKVFNLLGQVVHDHKRNHRPKFAKKEYKAVDSIVSCFIIYDNLRRYLLKWDKDFEEAEELLKTIAHDIHSVKPTLKTVVASHLFSKRKIKASNINSIVGALGFGNNISRDVQNIVSSSGTIIGIFNKLLKETREGEDARYEPAKEAYEALQEIFQRTISEGEIDDLIQFLESATTKDMEQEARDAFAKKRRRAGLLLSLVFAFMMGCSTGQDMAPLKPKYETSFVMAPIPLQSELYELSYKGLFNPHGPFPEDSVIYGDPGGQHLIIHDTIDIEKEGGMNLAADAEGNRVAVKDSISYENLNLIVLEFGEKLKQIRERNYTDATEEAEQIMQGIWQLLEEKGRRYKIDISLTVGTSQNDSLSVDCDMGSLIYVSIGQAYHLPIYLISLPQHAFVRWDSDDPRVAEYGFPKGVRFNWETTSEESEIKKKIRPDEYYGGRFGISHRPITEGPIYMKSLGGDEIRSYMYRVVASRNQYGKPNLALQLVNRSLELNPQNAPAYALRGDILSNMARNATFESIDEVNAYKRGVSSGHIDSTQVDRIKQRHSARMHRLFKEARKDYQRSLDIDPGLFHSYAAIAETFFEEGEYPAAIRNYSVAIDSCKELVYTYLCERGETFSKFAEIQNNKAKKDSLYRKAINDFSASLNTMPNDGLGKSYLKKALFGRGKARLALGETGVYAPEDRTHPAAGDYGAIGDLQAAAKADPHDRRIHRLLALELAKQGEDGDYADEALYHFRQAIPLWSTSYDIHLEMGRVLILKGGISRFAQAVSILNQILSHSPEYAEAQYLLGMRYLKTSDYGSNFRNTVRQAVYYFNKALQAGYDQPEVHQKLIRAYTILKEHEKELYHIDVLVDQNPGEIRFRLRRAAAVNRFLVDGIADETIKLRLLETATNDFLAYFEAEQNPDDWCIVHMGQCLVEYAELIHDSNPDKARQLCSFVLSHFDAKGPNYLKHLFSSIWQGLFLEYRGKAKLILGDPTGQQDIDRADTYR